eukprot:GEMP01061765.1.p1 GENE.GEMP01061765.1~~GEMP01061765.1.p1  ORF type:complete len:261 (+),score=51.22 GEMP01061765.1:238-1020(+)
MRFGKLTRLNAAGAQSVYNAVRAIVNVNEWERNPTPLPEKIMGPILYSETQKTLLAKALDAKNTLTTHLRDESSDKLLGKEGWIFLGEEEKLPSDAADLTTPLSVLTMPGDAKLMFKRLKGVSPIDSRNSGHVFAFAPEFTEYEDKESNVIKAITLHVCRIKSSPPVPSEDAVFLRPSKNIPSAAGAVSSLWEKRDQNNYPIVRAIGRQSVFLSIKMLVLAQRSPHDANGFCAYPSFFQQADGVAMMLQLVPNAERVIPA